MKYRTHNIAQRAAFLAVALIGAGVATPLRAQDVPATAAVEGAAQGGLARVVVAETSFFVGTVFSCFVVVDGPAVVEVPVFPADNQSLEFRYVGVHVTEIEGRRRHTFTFECLPRSPGAVVIPALELTAGAARLATEAVLVEVSAPEQTDEMKLALSLSARECYVGEAVELTFTWHSDLFLNGVRAVDIRLPVLRDPRFRVYEPSEAVDPNDSSAIGVPVENRRVIAELEEERTEERASSDVRFKKVIVPRTSGEIEIEPAVLLCSYVTPKDQKFSGFPMRR
ncbi:MAG: hypothetical protein ACC661_00685 [Verrucomicrobiales bacterium]